jgi:hypothetical protein
MSYDNYFWGGLDKAGVNVPNHTQWRIKAESLLASRDIFQATTVKRFPLGAIAESRDGRRWRYCENGAVALTLALGNQSSVGVAGWQDEIQTNNTDLPSDGDKIVNVVTTTTATAADFIDGYMTIEQGTGSDSLYIIKDNKTGVANATSGFDISVEIADTGGIRTTYTVASNITLTKNKWKDTVVFPTNPTGPCTGINLVAVPANSFYWAQTRGPCPVIKDSTDTIVVGDVVAIGANTAGQCCLSDAAAEGDTIIGYCMRAPANAETAIIDLTIE